MCILSNFTSQTFDNPFRLHLIQHPSRHRKLQRNHQLRRKHRDNLLRHLYTISIPLPFLLPLPFSSFPFPFITNCKQLTPSHPAFLSFVRITCSSIFLLRAEEESRSISLIIAAAARMNSVWPYSRSLSLLLIYLTYTNKPGALPIFASSSVCFEDRPGLVG